MNSIFFENLKVAISSIRANLIRAILTICIIAFGIMALIGMLTALNSLQASLTQNFAEMGSNTFKIKEKDLEVRYRHRLREKLNPIKYREAQHFVNNYKYPAITSLNFKATSSAVVKYHSEKTTPKIEVYGIDDNYMKTSGLSIEEGRNFTITELRYGANVVIIGNALRHQLMGDASPLGKRISVGSNKYQVVGLLKEKGTSLGFSGDNMVLMPLNAARKAFPGSDESYEIDVQVASVENLDPAINEAIGLFRVTRKLSAGKENDFEIVKSDQLAEMVAENLSTIRIITFIIGIITLLGAAIGLMNIMLVSVKERTKEIGTRMAIGASATRIREQFLTEAVVISQIGGLVGILLGIFIGNMVANFIHSVFVIPWGWIIAGFVICFVVGVSAGFYPANRASKLDPIEALRYE